MPKANMRDVAKYANVSVATVSHVINNTRFVAEETRQRVLASIVELGYSPDAMARIFKTGRKNLIGFIVPDIANEFFSTIIEEVEGVIGKENFKLIVSNTKETKSREAENIRVLASGIVDGLIIASTMESYHELEKLIPEGLPMVFIDRALPDCPCDTITISNYQSVYQGVEALILEGHSKIGYITGLPRLSTTAERLSAYRDAMEAYHLPVEEGFVQTGDSMSKSAVLHVDALIGIGCTALVVSNNVMADDVLYYLNEKDIKIGRDIAILGYNDGDRVNYNMRRMHMVRQPTVALGRTAGQQILDRIANVNLPVRHTMLQSTFVKRENIVK
ncbi:LacI family DNA-binding transcriptional regulator [Acetanaerobacterium elongatum]|uniref:Transcriptional regulator, LacI family n=1 Tax=Acetanaerobacterium elongatum TaxID=258515 RepID=A0A1G9USZ2_9FIRM|nr:LacI family DNA-binding transcriptional regulator [Acetanaerobacterium elongatum]SDM63033.1 transcriptional regulator, LacI family [Acetanaerobacterium elongatum]